MMSSRYSTDFKELKELGKGGFGKVFLCENVLDQKKYALKKIPIKDGHREKVLREVVALSTMHHHHVVRYFQAWIEDGCTVELSSSEEESTSDDSVKPNATLYIQMKFCPQTLSGLLESLRDSKTVLDTSTIWRYFRQTVEGLRYIHGQNFVHRDLTRSNIFLDDDQIVIGDFGLATFLHDMNSGGVVTGDAGNLLYIAPELKEQDGPVIVSDRADIFSLGLLLCDLLYQFKTDRERMEVFTKLRRGEFPESAEPILKDLLASTPSARPSASEILQRPLPWGEVGFDENYVRELEDKVRTLSAQLVEPEKIQSLNKMLNPLTDDTD